MSDELAARIEAVIETVETLLRWDCTEDYVPPHIDVPDDYEAGLHDAAKSARAALRGDDA